MVGSNPEVDVSYEGPFKLYDLIDVHNLISLYLVPPSRDTQLDYEGLLRVYEG